MTTAAEDVTNVLSRTTCGAHATHATSVFPCWSCDAARLIERLAAENSRLTSHCDEIDQLRVRLEEAIEAHSSWKAASASHWERAVAAESRLAARDAELAKERTRGALVCGATGCGRPIDLRLLSEQGWSGTGLMAGVTCLECRISWCMSCARRHFGDNEAKLAARDAELKVASDALTELSTLGGGRSHGNAIAQHALAKLATSATCR